MLVFTKSQASVLLGWLNVKPLFAFSASIRKSAPCRYLLTELGPANSWSAHGRAAHSIIHQGLFYEPVPIPGKQRLKTTSAKLEEK